MIAVLPVRQIHWTGAKMEARAWPMREVSLPWKPCPGCWAGGRWYAPDLKSWEPCGSCFGVCFVPSVGVGS